MPELLSRHQTSSRGISPVASQQTVSSAFDQPNNYSVSQRQDGGSFVGTNWPRTLTKNSSIVSQTYEPTFSFEKEEGPLRIQQMQPSSHSSIGGSGSNGFNFRIIERGEVGELQPAKFWIHFRRE